MKRLIPIAALALTFACAKEQTPDTSATPAPTSTASAAEKTYQMKATIVSRDPAKNTVNLDNEAVPGEMAAMKMDYELRGAKVDSLPANGTRVVVTVHDQNGTYYVTDVHHDQK
jgi:Cu/Ag efflux protein CusF